MKKILEKQNQLWVVIVGIAMIVGGFYLFLDIKAMEESGGGVRMKRAFKLIYDLGGKYTILALFEFLGIAFLISGILQLRGKL